MDIQNKNENYQNSINKSITINVLQFVDLHPSAIKNIRVSQNGRMLLVSRNKYSEIYCYNETAVTADQIIISQLIRREQCEYLLQINGVLVMLMSFQLKIEKNGKQKIYPFTNQLISIHYSQSTQKLYTFHQNECILWEISEEDNNIGMKFLQNQEQPYHISDEGIIQGKGKKIKPHIKSTLFTVLQQSQCGEYVFVGTDSGAMHVFQKKFMTIVKTFHRHQASILAIKSTKDTVFFSGSDSKISSLKLNRTINQWYLSLQVRGQSHDITTLAITKNSKYLISGGLTTDICFYQLNSSMQFASSEHIVQKSEQVKNKVEANWSHKVSYSSENLVQSLGKYLIVNMLTSFEIWKVGSVKEQKYDSTQLIVRYEHPSHKNIKNIRVKYWNQKKQSFLIIVVTQYQTVTWVFRQSKGLLKHSTISNSYDLIEPFNDYSSVLTLKDGRILQKLDYKTGRIIELIETGIKYPTQLKICNSHMSNGNYQVLIGSKYSKDIQIYQICERKKLKGCQLHTRVQLSNYYQLIDFYGTQKVMIKYFESSTLKYIDLQDNNKQVDIVQLPLKKIRYGGWIHKQMSQQTKKMKTFWYGVSEGKILIVSNMGCSFSSKNKKIRIKQFPRIGGVVQNNEEYSECKQWDLGVVPLHFRDFIREKVADPIIVKKIQ